MTNNPDYRLYLESEFKSIRTLFNAQFDSVHDKLDQLEKKTDRIEIQTTKTNGRVTELEYEVRNDLPHTVNGCPQKDVIHKIHEIVIGEEAILKRKQVDSEMSHATTVRWIMIAGILLSVVVSVAGMVINRKSTAALKNEVNMINTPVRTRGGVIELWPSGVVIDSLNKIDNEEH